MKADLLGPSGRPRLANDAYFTVDPLAVKTLAEAMQLNGLRVWEPAAGRGDLVRELAEQGAEIACASDLVAHEGRRGSIHVGVDFLACTSLPDGIEAIITNPPSNQTVKFVQHALELCPHGTVAMLLRHEWICRKWVPGRERLAKWVPVRGRLRWFAERSGNPRHNFAWGIWHGPIPNGGCRLVV